MNEHVSWTTAKTEDLQQAFASYIDALEKEHSQRISLYKEQAMLYAGYHITGFTPGEYDVRAANVNDEISPVYNVIRSAIDTLVSKITMHRPRPKVLTTGGDEELQQAAKLAEKYIAAVLQDQKVYKKAKSVFRDSCIYGLGAMKVMNDGERVIIECVHPSRILVDNGGCLTTGMPTQLVQYDFLSRAKLLEMFPKHKVIIKDAAAFETGHSEILRDLIKVYEGWSLPLGNTKGRRVIYIDKNILLDEEYDRPLFPFVFMKYSDGLMGFYGSGIVEILSARQKSIARTAAKIEENHDLLAVTRIFVPEGSNIPPEHLATNENCTIIPFNPQFGPPVVSAPNPVSPQVMQKLNDDIQSAYEEIGLSQLSASGQKPAGLNAAVAMRTFLDTETIRFSDQSDGYYQAITHLSEHIIQQIPDLAPDGSLTYTGVDQFEQLRNGDIDFDKQNFNLDIYPSSSLPHDPSGRLEKVLEMMNAGMVDPEEGRALLDFSDLEKTDSLAAAPRNDLEAAFEHMLIKGTYIKPIEFQNLELGIKLALHYWSKGHVDGLSEKKLALLERWMTDAKEILTPPPAPPPAPPMGPPLPPGAPMDLVLPMPPMGPPGAPPPPGALPMDMGPLPPEGVLPPGGMPPLPLPV